MGSETLLTRLDLETLWGMGKDGVNARLRKYGADVRKVQKGNTVTFAVTREEADRIELAAVESALEARRKSGATRTREVSKRKPARAECPIKVASPAPTTARKRAKKPAGWHKTMTHLLTHRQPEPTAPRLPPCEPTVAGVIARYHVSKQVVRGWILDGLMRVDADGTVDAESMARVKRCYQERRPTRWMEKTLAEFGSL